MNFNGSTITPAVFPACAGMDRRPSRRRAVRGRFPRVRGDGPRLPRRSLHARPFSPRARGWTVFTDADAAMTHVFPACAGMDRGPGRGRFRTSRFPRVRGDGPGSGTAVVVTVYVFPACAGMDRLPMRRRGKKRAFSPRARGWTEPKPETQSWRETFSPRARGWTGRRFRDRRRVNTFSPRARGWTAHRVPWHGAARRFPRVRGDGPAHVERRIQRTLVFPACAGMDRADGRWPRC